MSLVNSIFDNICRIGNDDCDLTNKNIQNNKAANYLLENYNEQPAMTNIIDLATNQPNIFYSGCNEGGINGNCINENNALKFSQSTRIKERNNAQKRLFCTVPYLGKGPSNAVLESQIQIGDMIVNKKSLDPNSEVSHIDFNYYPLIPSLEATVANPANLVEGVAAEGWVRGGIPTRELNREGDSQVASIQN